MYLSGSATSRGNELEQNEESWDSKGELLFVTGCILLIKWIHLAFGIPLLCFQPGKKKSYLGQNLNILCWKKPESQGEFYFYCCLYYLSPQIISLGIGRKISRCYKILLCRYLQMHSIDVICHLKSQILTDVPWIRCTLNNAFSRYHAYDLFET